MSDEVLLGSLLAGKLKLQSSLSFTQLHSQEFCPLLSFLCEENKKKTTKMTTLAPVLTNQCCPAQEWYLTFFYCTWEWFSFYEECPRLSTYYSSHGQGWEVGTSAKYRVNGAMAQTQERALSFTVYQKQFIAAPRELKGLSEGILCCDILRYCWCLKQQVNLEEPLSCSGSPGNLLMWMPQVKGKH